MKVPNFVLVIFLIVTIVFVGCSGGKMSYEFDQGKNLDFSQGIWILNQPKANQDRSNTIYKIAKTEFEKFIPQDSLKAVFDLRKSKLIGTSLPFNPSQQELQEIRLTSECDYLINIENEIIGEDDHSFRTSRAQGVSEKVNIAQTTIKIYDLKNQKLISKATSIAKDKVTEREDSGFNYLTSGILLANKSVYKLIQEYRKNQK